MRSKIVTTTTITGCSRKSHRDFTLTTVSLSRVFARLIFFVWSWISESLTADVLTLEDAWIEHAKSYGDVIMLTHAFHFASKLIETLIIFRNFADHVSFFGFYAFTMLIVYNAFEHLRVVDFNSCSLMLQTWWLQRFAFALIAWGLAKFSQFTVANIAIVKISPEIADIIKSSLFPPLDIGTFGNWNTQPLAAKSPLCVKKRP